ncbi:hypothetical protein V494_03592 [Pseudogymnoascus sp. VKM F-4513 (FW-928)]|nr:hypothetical protein V494_03592 [Pseudogymnoascus sp. VKM F-4513 (FW-928)]
MSAHETHQNEQDPEEGQKPQHRRRIPVACGRCRKRKIKCSGPQGDDGCHNCKLAGNDHCQFNRVQSEELPFVKDSFNYDSSAALRTIQRPRGLPCYTAAYGTPSMGNTLASQQSYRQIPLNEYQYPTKATYYTAPYGIDYTDDGVDYSIMPHGFPQFNQDQIGLQYAPNPPARPWTPVPGSKSAGNAACYDSDSACAYTSAQPLIYNHSASYPSRSSISTESSNFSFHGMASSLPATSALTSNERVLPIPARPLTRTSDGVIYSNSVVPSSTPVIKLMENETPLSVSSDGTSHSYSSTDNTGEQDLYAGTSSGWANSDQDHQPSLRSQASHPQLFNYGTSTDNLASRKLQMDGGGTLCDGSVYVPFTSTGSGRSCRSGQALSDDQEPLHEATLHQETISSVAV